MSPETYQRKLTAILNADVAGYSRLMGEDEAATIKTLNTYKEIMTALVQQHHGRVVDFTGDNLLAEFASVVDAVQYAVAMQKELQSRNAELPDSRRMEFRIGINLGDVIEEGDRIYGDGVNIAARLEALADPGGICISKTAFDHIESKLPLGYEYLGNQTVKNIAKPVGAYRVTMEPRISAVGRREKFKRWTSGRRGLALSGAVAVLITVSVIALWDFFFSPSFEPTSTKRIKHPLSDKPSIAVLPFVNLSSDASEDYFSDGITNDIITDLSKFRDLFVIASNTVFTYKAKPVPVDEVGRQLNVRYILEGSVQKSGERLRVNTQFIDAETAHHLWAERYERELKDLFKVQDEIIEAIVKKLALKIDEIERARAMRKGTKNLEAYDYLLQGRHHYAKYKRSANIKARELFKKALDLDPDYAAAHVELGRTYNLDFDYGWTEFSEETLRRAETLARKALDLDKSNVAAHLLLGDIYYRQLKFDIADVEYQKAIALNPNDVISLKKYGVFMLYSGHPDKAVHLIENSLRFDPQTTPGNLMNLSFAYYLKGRYADAIRNSKQALVKHPDFAGHHIALAAAYAQLGRKEDAAQAAEKVRELFPFMPIENFGSIFLDPEDRAAIMDGLQKAGLK